MGNCTLGFTLRMLCFRIHLGATGEVGHCLITFSKSNFMQVQYYARSWYFSGMIIGTRLCKFHPYKTMVVHLNNQIMQQEFISASCYCKACMRDLWAHCWYLQLMTYGFTLVVKSICTRYGYEAMKILMPVNRCCYTA